VGSSLLDVGNGEETALQAVARGGGQDHSRAYMGRESERGKPRTKTLVFLSPGGARKRFVTISTALERMVEVLGKHEGERRKPITPRARGAAMSDALAEARIALARLTQLAILRGAGLLVLLSNRRRGPRAGELFSSDPSLNNATGGAVTNWLGPLGATAADVLLQAFGIAAFAFLHRSPCGARRALMGKGLSRAVVARRWPGRWARSGRGRSRLAASTEKLPAGMGGWIGIAASSLSNHAARSMGRAGSVFVLPLLLLVAGLPARLHRHGPAFLQARRAPSATPRRGLLAGTRSSF